MTLPRFGSSNPPPDPAEAYRPPPELGVDLIEHVHVSVPALIGRAEQVSLSLLGPHQIGQAHAVTLDHLALPMHGLGQEPHGPQNLPGVAGRERE